MTINIEILNKTYNALLEEIGLDPDKYEREDAFMGVLIDVQNGVDPGDAFSESFDLVHGIYISPNKARSYIALCGGLYNGKQN